MGNLRQKQSQPAKACVKEQTKSSKNSHLDPAEELQEMLGNQGLGRFIESQSHQDRNALQRQISTANNSPIQRRPLFRGLSHELMGNGQGNLVQAKLTVNQPGDKYEQEADRVAEQVVKQINAPSDDRLVQAEAIQTEKLMRKSVSSPGAVAGGMAAPPDLETSIKQKQGNGQPLSQDIREPIEQSFNHDFSGVRLHTDDQSDKLNRSIQSVAFTQGQDIFFKRGAYQPTNREGQKLLIHELTHVVQQGSTNTLQTKIQRTKEDGELLELDIELLDPKIFLKATKHTIHFRRGEYLKTIDKWLEALQTAKTWDEQQKALSGVTRACTVFLDYNDLEMQAGLKEKDWDLNMKVRKPVEYIEAISSGLLASPDRESSSTNSQATAPAMEETSIIRGRLKEGTEGALGIIDTNTVGGLDDIRKTTYGDKFKSDYLDLVNNSGGGLLNSVNAGKELFSKENGALAKFDAGGQLFTGTGQMAHGLGKGIKVTGGHIKGEKFKDGIGNAFGEVGGAVGDIGGSLGGLISVVTRITEVCRHSKELTKKEKIDAILEISGSIFSMAQSAVKGSSGVMKSIKAIGGKEVANTVTGLGYAASSLGLITSLIQGVRGGFEIYRGFSSKKQVETAEEEQNKIIAKVDEGLQQVMAELPALFEVGNREEILAVGEEMRELRDTLVQLQEVQIQSAPAMEAIKKIGNRRMEEGSMKLAGGALGAVSSVLVLSGIGAPVAIAIGALGGLLALGYAGVNLARNLTAKSLITTAKRLTDDGIPKPEPDSKPDYRIMEEKVYKCYYNHLPKVLEKNHPPGMDSSEFTKVKEFVWDDKKKRVNKLDKITINRPSEADDLDKTTKQNKWIEVQDFQGNITHQERPKGFQNVIYTFTPSAHKSKQSLNASKQELAVILTLLCMQSYDSESQQFINSPIEPMGEADPETLAEFGHLTLKTLLSAADITDKRWSRWFEKFGGDADQLQDKVLDHIS